MKLLHSLKLREKINWNQMLYTEELCYHWRYSKNIRINKKINKILNFVNSLAQVNQKILHLNLCSNQINQIISLFYINSMVCIYIQDTLCSTVRSTHNFQMKKKYCSIHVNYFKLLIFLNKLMQLRIKSIF